MILGKICGILVALLRSCVTLLSLIQSQLYLGSPSSIDQRCPQVYGVTSKGGLEFIGSRWNVVKAGMKVVQTSQPVVTISSRSCFESNGDCTSMQKYLHFSTMTSQTKYYTISQRQKDTGVDELSCFFPSSIFAHSHLH